MISAYDVMGEVFTHASVRRYDGDGFDTTPTTYTVTTTFEGSGEAEDDNWLKDALIALIEAI